MSVVPAGALIVAVLATLPLVAVTLAATVISKNWPEASAGRAKPPTLSSWAAVGVVPTVHWPGVAEQARSSWSDGRDGILETAPVTLLGPLLVTRIV